ncbi:MAG TPA: cytochrome C [Thermoanaerobaculia bacterium]|nr:cytochrome C [Thermoanaerobaculia bacterium]
MKHKLLWTALFFFVIVAVGGVVAGQQGQPGAVGQRAPADPETQRIVRGFLIAPVPLNLRGKDRALVGLGSYIVNAQAGCNDCHTNPSYAPGHDPYLGEPKQINVERYLAGGREFGPVVSDNITPDEDGKPAGLTFQEFRTLIRTGHEPGEDEILQVMPWPIFKEMKDHDLQAIYEYLRSIPHIDGGDEE